VDLGIIHPYAVVTQDAALLVSGRALRAENYLHLKDQQARRAKAARRAPTPGQRGSRRWRRHRARLRRAEARHRRRIHQAQHQAAKQVVAFAVQQGRHLAGRRPNGITKQAAGRVQNWRLRQWRRTHLVQALRDKAERAGIVVRLVDARGTSSTCPVCHQRVPKPKGRRFRCCHCGLEGHRNLVGAANIAAKAGGGPTSTGVPVLWSTVGPASCRRGVTDAAISMMLGGAGPAWPRATHPTIWFRVGVARWASSTWRLARIKQRSPPGHTLPEGALDSLRDAEREGWTWGLGGSASSAVASSASRSPIAWCSSGRAWP
jgi:hypothetical protein